MSRGKVVGGMDEIVLGWVGAGEVLLMGMEGGWLVWWLGWEHCKVAL